jgi:hypothetical protein
MLGSCCARAKEAPAHSAVTRTARRALPVEMGMGRYNHRNATLMSFTRIVNTHILAAPDPPVNDGPGTGTVEQGPSHLPAPHHIVSQRINIRVAIRYRAVRTIRKTSSGTAKPRTDLLSARHLIWRAQFAAATGRRLVRYRRTTPS